MTLRFREKFCMRYRRECSSLKIAANVEEYKSSDYLLGSGAKTMQHAQQKQPRAQCRALNELGSFCAWKSPFV